MKKHVQKFNSGDLVRITKNLGSHMSHFASNCDAIVIGSYADQFGGSDIKSYTLYLKEKGESSWYEEWQLILIKHNQEKILKQWKTEEKNERKLKSNLDWIFEHGDEVLSQPHGASISAIANCFGLTNLWGNHGEGITYYSNANITMALAKPFLKSKDKIGWLKKANKIKIKLDLF